MSYRIKKVAVLGSGVMGSGIACHLANINMDVLLLDIVPGDNPKDKADRNSIVNNSLKAAIKSKPALLYSKSFAGQIKTGNFEDDFEKISDADWIIEVVVENLDIKRSIYEKIEKYRKQGSLVSSNTSSIPIKLLAQGRSEDFSKHFCGTHFFNPVRYMPLLEIIPHKETDESVTEFFMHFGDRYLGKQTVLCKDTPAFIANRIGVMSGIRLFQLTEKYSLKIEEVDALTGTLINRPNTATFRLQDLVGIDTGDKVSRFVISACPEDEFIKSLDGPATPAYIQFLLDNKFLGKKTGKGFYEKTNKKDDSGKTIINALNLETLKYEPSIKPKSKALSEAKKIEIFDKRLQNLLEGDEKENKFLAEYFASLLAYSANRIPEISDDIYSVDDAMRAGYMWGLGPFEYWDQIGFDKGIELILSHDEELPEWIEQMKLSGASSFYRIKDGSKQYYDLSDRDYKNVPSAEGLIILDAYREKTPVIKNSECVVHDIGEGVMCLEFQSKSNAIGQGIGEALFEAVQKAENENWSGIVIGNQAKNFTVGANLMNVGMLAMQKDFKSLDKMVDEFQQLNMYLRTSKIPVVVATQGYVFGGGCEISMHCDAGIYAAESYIGLVEVGVGLLPGGGGTKEMAVRASDSFFEGDVQIPTLIDHFKPIATATVATSAYEAFEHNLLLGAKDEICLKASENILFAKEKVLELSEGYVAGSKRDDITVLGRTGLSALYTAINEFRLGNYMSDYDVEIARKVAYVICGGDLTGQQTVSEQYLLDIEREAFLSLLGNQKTLDRIQHILMYNKPLRN